MSKDTTLRFDFYTSSSGNFQSLLARLDMSKEEATAKALTYYALYINGVHHGGRQLVMVDPSGQEAWPIDADVTDAHQHSDTLPLTFNKTTLEHIAASGYKASPSDMLTSAFLLLETICDIRDSDYGLGLYDSHAQEVIPLKADEHSPAPTSEGLDRLVLALAPNKHNLN